MFGKTTALLIIVSMIITATLGLCSVYAFINAGGFIGTVFALIVIHTIVTCLAIFSVVGLVLAYIWISDLRDSKPRR